MKWGRGNDFPTCDVGFWVVSGGIAVKFWSVAPSARSIGSWKLTERRGEC